MYRKTKINHIHFVGIGGIGMSGIAEVLLNLGYEVSGSDIRQTEITHRLEQLGARVYYQHRGKNIEGSEVVVVSSAIKEGNPEIKAAGEKLIPVIPRAEMLAELMRMKYGVAVAGTHGKTTTTSLIATVLAHGGLDPTVVTGGKLNSIGSSAKLGQGDFLVAEADESDGSFLKLLPTIAVVTNIDPEHLDYYQGIEQIKETFLQFIDRIPFFGLAVLCLDQENVQSLIPELKKRFTTYGLSSQADFQAKDMSFDGPHTSFDLVHRDKRIGRLTVQMPGIHNVYNVLATVATAFELDVDFKTVHEALAGFSGIQRRFERKAEIEDILVFDDYGHHPAEIKATLRAAKRGWRRRVVALFQPHRYTRTKALFDDFLTAFYEADVLVITDIYPAGEEEIQGVHARHLSEGIREHGHRGVHYMSDRHEIIQYLLTTIIPGDLVITLGAGDIYRLGEDLVEELRKKYKAESR
jgi:UDP-N-acetylmuramate--alanine ligase